MESISFLETFHFILNILKVVLGLGFVIFLHELGHFLVAKWSGVYVKSFSVGFPPTIFSKKWGETEYKIGILFLGGYVSMLGEGVENSEEDPDAVNNPRSFKNQTVAARIAILSAGVVMNLFLGLTFFFITHLVGVEVIPATIGGVQAGSPAYEAGLRAGDEIVAIDGDPDVTYVKMRLRVFLSATGRVLRFDVKRPGVPTPFSVDIKPKRQAGRDMPNIGVLQGASLDLDSKIPLVAPAGMTEKAPTSGKLLGGETVVAIGPVGSPPTPVANFDELQHALMTYRDRPIEVVVDRKPDESGKRERGMVVLPVNHFVRLGFRTEFGPLTSSRQDSIGAKSGFALGDRIVKVDGRDDFDPFDLPTYCYEHAGQPIKFVVSRKLGNGQFESVELSAKPDQTLPWSEIMLEDESFEIPGLGLALDVIPKVVAVTPGSAADKAGIKPGMTISTVEFVDPKIDEKKRKSQPVSLEDVPAWPYIFNLLQHLPARDLRLTFKENKTPIIFRPEVDLGSFHPDRGLGLLSLSKNVPPQSFGVSIRRACDDTYENVVSIYAMLRSLVQRRVSTKSLAGLPRIAEMAYHSADTGVVRLLQFLAMLSINLAVLNFMPIPPLDGGQIALILAEKIRGRPVPVHLFNAIMIGGFVLLIGLMLFTNIQDIVIMIRGR